MSLIGTGDVRSWLDIPTADTNPNAKLATLCDAIQKFTETYLNRKLEAQQFTTHPDYCYLDGTGQSYVYAPVYPIWSISEVAIDNDRDFDSGTIVDSDDIFFYPDGKIISEAGRFVRGRRNVRLSYYAGYGATTGSYVIPADLKQVMVEMVVNSYKTGLTAIHQINLPTGEAQVIKLLSNNTFWQNTLNRYKRIASLDVGYDD